MLEIIPEETALLIVDPQNDYCHPDGNLGQSGVDMSVWQTVTPQIKSLIKICHDARIQDIWSRHYNVANDSGKMAKRIQPHTAKRKNLSAQPGTWGSEFVDELSEIMRLGFAHMQDDEGGSVYLRLSTRNLDQPNRDLGNGWVE